VINPTVEELYFRGYLLPRLPVAGWRAIPLSAPGEDALRHEIARKPDRNARRRCR